MGKLNIKEMTQLTPVKEFGGVSIPAFNGKYYRVDLDAYQAHITSVVGEKMKMDGGLSMKFAGFTNNDVTGGTCIAENAEVWYSTQKKMFVFKDGNIFYAEHKKLTSAYNDGNSIRQDKMFLCGNYLYCYDAVLGIDKISSIKVVSSLDAPSADEAASTQLVKETADDLNERKVEKELGKGLSAEDYTTEDKIKLATLQNYDDTEVKNQLGNKVEKELGKGLSSEDYTNEEKAKLAGIEEGAQKNVLPVQELGDSETDVVSQKVTKEVDDYFRRNLGLTMDDRDIFVPVYQSINGYINSEGNVVQREYTFHTSPILVKKNQSVLVYQNSFIEDAFYKTDENGTFYEKADISFKFNGNWWRLFTATEDTYISISYIKTTDLDESVAGGFPFRVYIVYNGVFANFAQKFGLLFNKSDLNYENLFKFTGTVRGEETPYPSIYIPSYEGVKGFIRGNQIIQQDNYFHTTPIKLDRGDSLIVYEAAVVDNIIFGTNKEGTEFTDLNIESLNTSDRFSYEWYIYTATEDDTYVSVNYRIVSKDSKEIYVLRNGFYYAFANAIKKEREKSVNDIHKLENDIYGNEIENTANKSGSLFFEHHIPANTKFALKVHIDGVYERAFIYTDIAGNNGRIWASDSGHETDKLYFITKEQDINKFYLYLKGAETNVTLTVYDLSKLNINTLQIEDNAVTEDKLSLEVQAKLNKDKAAFNRFYDSNIALANNTALTLPKVHIQKNCILTAKVSEVVEKILLGVGYDSGRTNPNTGYDSKWLEITPTEIKEYHRFSDAPVLDKTYSITIPMTTNTIISYDTILEGKVMKSSIKILNNKGDIQIQELAGYGSGMPFIENQGTQPLSVELTYFPKDINKKIWLFGDSYISFTNPARWVYYFTQWGYTNFLSNNQPGLSPSGAFGDLENMLMLNARPTYLLWLLGMNGGGDVSASQISSYQKEYIDKVVALCKKEKITPVFGLIPTVPTQQKTAYCNYIKSLRVRYIDFAKAVNTNEQGVWTNGLLSGDGVHPSELGAKVLASQVLIDFPELSISE